jgi:hypothetical protein
LVTTVGGFASDVAVQPSGRIVAAGQTNDSLPSILLRGYDAIGHDDATFGSAGQVITAVGAGSIAVGIAARHDGAITIAAISGNAPFVVALYDQNGTLDPAFGTNGVTTTQIGSNPASGANAARTLTLELNGTIVVGGLSDGQLTLLRYESTPMAPYCGDGVVNGTEECDEGTANGHVSCCAADCTLRAAAFVCRPAVNACDVAEQCDGSSSLCASDAQLADGTPCDDGSLCTTGDVCTNHVCGGTPVTCPTCQACDPSSGSCVLADGIPCDDGDACTTNDTCSSGACGGTAVTCPVCETCDSVAGCVATPRNSCTLPPAADSTLTIAQGTSPANAKLLWTWSHGQATAVSFGDPTTTDDYAFCIYGGTAQSPSVVFGARIPAGGLCVGKPCWKALGTPPGAKGFKYHYKYRRPDGIDKLILKPGDGNAKLSLKGVGANLTIPALPPTLPLRAQLQGPPGACWEADYSAAGVRKPGPPKFKGRSD